MPMEKGFYDGRRGQKRLRAIEKQIAKVSTEFDSIYIDSPEMIFLNDEVRWEGSARLLFTLAMRNINYMWEGTRDYGFIRLCSKWICDNDVPVMTRDDVEDMLRDIMPLKMYTALEEQTAAFETA